MEVSSSKITEIQKRMVAKITILFIFRVLGVLKRKSGSWLTISAMLKARKIIYIFIFLCKVNISRHPLLPITIKKGKLKQYISAGRSLFFPELSTSQLRFYQNGHIFG